MIVPIPDNSPFPIQNLPYGVFSTAHPAAWLKRVGVAIGEHVLDLAQLEQAGVLDIPFAQYDTRPVFESASLNYFMALGPTAWRAVREQVAHLLLGNTNRYGTHKSAADIAELMQRALVPMADVTMHLPVEIGDYTDFYSSRQHATNVGAMFRDPANALLPNWLHVPVGYHGRASSVVLSGTDILRPMGQTRPDDAAPPVFGPTKQLDFELEVGFLVGSGNALGEPIPVEKASEHVFGMVLVNDWSARDIQRWEYVPLGPFLAKNFATSISPWVVPMEALAPFRVAGEAQSGANPEPLPYLRQAEPRALDLTLQVTLETERMRAEGAAPHRISRTNAKHLYWSPEQQLAHHTVGGCPMRPGDLLASGTISGDAPDSYGSLLELTWRGERPLTLPSGETRKFLQDGDRLVMTGWGEGEGEDGPYRIGFGEVAGTVCPARSAA